MGGVRSLVLATGGGWVKVYFSLEQGGIGRSRVEVGIFGWVVVRFVGLDSSNMNPTSNFGGFIFEKGFMIDAFFM